MTNLFNPLFSPEEPNPTDQPSDQTVENNAQEEATQVSSEEVPETTSAESPSVQEESTEPEQEDVDPLVLLEKAVKGEELSREEKSALQALNWLTTRGSVPKGVQALYERVSEPKEVSQEETLTAHLVNELLQIPPVIYMRWKGSLAGSNYYHNVTRVMMILGKLNELRKDTK